MKNKNKNLNIAIISDAIYPYNKGGKEKRLFEISTRLAKRGYDVTIYCMKWWPGNEIVKFENGVKLQAISKLYPLYSGKRRSFKQAIFFTLSTMKLLKEDFDIIDADHMPHLVMFPLKFVSLIKRKKFYATWNEVWGKEYWNKYLGKLGTIAFFIEWLSARLPDEIIAVSEHTKLKLISDLKVKQKISVVPNGIDYNQIKEVEPAFEKSDVIYAGRLLEHKNVDLIIKSISELKDKFQNIKCLIIGNGPEEKKLKELVKIFDLQKNIIFLDFLKDHTALYSLFKSSKVFAFPSTREGFGIAALEANACGIPFVTSNNVNNATKNLIEEQIKNGEIALPKPEEIAKKIELLIKKSNEFKKNKFKEYAQNYDWDNIAEEIEEVYGI